MWMQPVLTLPASENGPTLSNRALEQNQVGWMILGPNAVYTYTAERDNHKEVCACVVCKYYNVCGYLFDHTHIHPWNISVRLDQVPVYRVVHWRDCRTISYTWWLIPVDHEQTYYQSAGMCVYVCNSITKWLLTRISFIFTHSQCSVGCKQLLHTAMRFCLEPYNHPNTKSAMK